MQLLRSLYHFIKKLDSFLGMTAMAFIILLACANVFMRYVVGRPWGWVEEITVFTFVWLTMLGASAVVHNEGHIAIDTLVQHCSPRWQRIINTFADLVVLVTLALLIYYGIELTIRGQTKLTPILGLPYSYINVSFPVCCGFMFIYYAAKAWNNLLGRGDTTQLEGEAEEVLP